MAGNNGNAPEHIILNVLGEDNTVLQYKIKKHAPLKKLMHAYCERKELSIGVMRFLYDGQYLGERDTPSSLNMEEGDTIEVYPQQIGGFSMCRNRN